MWNHARGWGYTDLPNPCEGIQGHSLDKRMLYVTEAMYKAVYEKRQRAAARRNGLDLPDLSAPADALRMSEHDFVDGYLIVTQDKTKQPLRTSIAGKLAELIARIRARKASHKIVTAGLLTNTNGKRLTSAVLRNHFHEARKLAAEAHPQMAEAIMAFHFYDLRAKAPMTPATSVENKQLVIYWATAI